MNRQQWDTLHELVEHELGVAYEAGYQAGMAAAGRAVNNAIADACHGIPATAEQVVARLVRTWDRKETSRRREVRRPVPYSGGNGTELTWDQRQLFGSLGVAA